MSRQLNCDILIFGADMRRREFIAGIGGVAAAWPIAARSQQPMPVVGYLSTRSSASDEPLLTALRQGLSKTGYTEGRNVKFEPRFSDGQSDRLPALAADLVRRNVSVIVAAGGELTAPAARAASATIPIIFTVADDPVRLGLVTSLNRPGGNLTGVASFLGELGPKQFGLLRELVPKTETIAVLVNPDETWSEPSAGLIQEASRALGQKLIILKANTEPEIDAAFATLVQARAGALLVMASPYFFTRVNHIIELAARNTIPAIYFRREIAEAGGMASYGTSTDELYGLMGIYAGRILGGAKPADLPVMQPTRFELVINLKTAKALGLEIPATLLARADQVIE
jgi:putative ABC transport system substrate-binding protein